MMEKLKNKKIQYTLTFGAVAAAVLLFQGIMPNKPPKIISISPDRGYPGIVVTITGSGFTKQSDNISETRIGGQKLDPGNYIKILGEVQNSHAFSLDGVTLRIKLDLNTNRVVQECVKRVNQNKPCEVGIKVVNAYGVESNEFNYLVINRPPPLRANYEIIPLNPSDLTQDIPLKISDTVAGKEMEVLRYKLTADSGNDAPIYVLVAGVSVKSEGGVPVDCLKLFYRNNVAVVDVSGNGEGASPFLLEGYSASGWCYGWPTGWTFTLAPGEQKTLSVRAKANLQAPVGYQFRLVAANSLTSEGEPYVGDREVWISNSSGSDWLWGGAEWSNIITIAP